MTNSKKSFNFEYIYNRNSLLQGSNLRGIFIKVRVGFQIFHRLLGQFVSRHDAATCDYSIREAESCQRMNDTTQRIHWCLKTRAQIRLQI